MSSFDIIESLSIDEVEITPEMIRAGAAAVCTCLGCGVIYAPMTEEKMAVQVFMAMIARSELKHLPCGMRDK